jgi:ABC-2 type transport system ATP-binding protein
VWEVVSGFIARGGTVLLTTHYMEEAALLCHRVAIIDHGVIIALDTPARLVEALGADQIIELKVQGDLDSGSLARLPGVGGATASDGGFMLSVRSVGVALPALLGELERRRLLIESLTTHQPTLNDVFVQLTGRGLRDG